MPGASEVATCEELMRLLSEDPQAGSAELFHCFAPGVTRQVRRLVGPDPDLDDLVQLAFLRILTGWRNVREPGKLPGWIRAVTTNTVNDELRRRDVRRRFLSSVQGSDYEGDFVREVEERDLLAAAFQALDQLPWGWRRPVELRYLEDRPVDCVARACNVSVSTVQRRVRAALGSAKRSLAVRVSADRGAFARSAAKIHVALRGV